MKFAIHDLHSNAIKLIQYIWTQNLVFKGLRACTF